MTVLGNAAYTGGSSFAAVLRRGTGGHYFNHIFSGFPNGIEMRDTATSDQATADNLYIKNSIFFGNDAAGDGDNWPAAQATGDIDEETLFMQSGWMNQEIDPELDADAFDLAAPVFALPADAAALTGGATPPNDGFFDNTATFIGAVGTDDWTAGWTSYPQN